MTPDGLISIPSRRPAKEAADRLAAAIAAAGVQVFARIDHAAGAAGVGLALRPTEVVIFGDPRAGTPLMQQAQEIGLDLPLKVLVWQDETGQTRLGYVDPLTLGRRYGLDSDRAVQLKGMAAALRRLCEAAAGD